MADRIVVMRDGVVEQSGPALDLYDRPAQQIRGVVPGFAVDEFPVGSDREDAAAGLRREDGSRFALAGDVAASGDP